MTTIGSPTKKAADGANVTALRPHELAVHMKEGKVKYSAYHTAKSARHEAKRLAGQPGVVAIAHQARTGLITDTWSTIWSADNA